MSTSDRIIRFIVVIVLLPLLFISHVKGIFEIIIMVISILFLFTSATAICPFYKSINIHTNKPDDLIKIGKKSLYKFLH
ncbi:YgaP family membrane protein [Flavivirga aquatica]|uniref:YgaP family membrane protein n=1 Tax=Flavivirga aquatica TaxID=1849968 RepID=UPI0009F66B03